MNKEGDIEIETLIWWIVALVVLVVVILGFFVLQGKGTGALEYLKNLLRFGR